MYVIVVFFKNMLHLFITKKKLYITLFLKNKILNIINSFLSHIFDRWRKV